MAIEKKLVDSSRQLIEYVVADIDGDPELFNETLEIAFTGKPQISSRAARVVTFCLEDKPELIEPHLNKLVENTIQQKNKSVVMNFLKIFTFNILPKDDEALGKLVNFCFECLINKVETAAITVYSMEILYLVSQQEPGLIPELKAVIEERIPFGSAGVKNRGKRTLKKLQNLM